MAYGGYSYIDMKYKPANDDFIVLMWASGTVPINKIAEAIAAESSVGTWTKLKTMNMKVLEKLKANVFRIDRVTAKSGFIWIAYPFEHFDTKNVIQFQASVLGNIFGLKELTDLRILDISFPKKYQKQFPGPYGGIEGVRKYVGTLKSRRPHLGTIVKPKVGLTPKEFAAVAYEAYMGGCDFVKDDENLSDQKFCPFKQRFEEMMEVIDRVKSETGRKVLYSPNISDRFERMAERLDFIHFHGAPMAMVDVFVVGYSALEDILNEIHGKRMLTHAHRAGYACESRGEFGITFTVHEKFYRMLGVDQLHVGTGVGKMEGSPLFIKRLRDVISLQKVGNNEYLGSIEQEWDAKMKPVMPVASGGVGPDIVDSLILLHGRDVVVQAGGGIHGHPKGTRAGATAMKQAIEAAVKGIPAPKYAKTHKELAEALKIWKYKPSNTVKKLLAQEKKREKTLRKSALSKGIKEIEKYW